jgi:hypothetical protein
MSQRTRTGLLNVQIKEKEHQQAWRAAEQAVAETLDEDPENLTRQEIARELSEAYCGRDACGRWKNGESNG